MGNVLSNTPTSPDGTPGDDDQVLTFTRQPSLLTLPGVEYVSMKENGSSEGIVTNNIQTFNQGRMKMGPDGIDKYTALRLKIDVLGDKNCNVTFSDFVYEYEVLR